MRRIIHLILHFLHFTHFRPDFPRRGKYLFPKVLEGNKFHVNGRIEAGCKSAVLLDSFFPLSVKVKTLKDTYAPCFPGWFAITIQIQIFGKLATLFYPILYMVPPRKNLLNTFQRYSNFIQEEGRCNKVQQQNLTRNNISSFTRTQNLERNISACK